MSDNKQEVPYTEEELKELITSACSPNELLECFGFNDDIAVTVEALSEVIWKHRMSIIDNLKRNGVIDIEEDSVR